MLLQFAGHETHVVHDGLAAVDAAADARPGRRPARHRSAGAEWIRSRSANPRTKRRQAPPPVLIALTGWGQDEDRRRSQEAGFDAHLVKPVDVVVLGKMLAELGASKQEGQLEGG